MYTADVKIFGVGALIGGGSSVGPKRVLIMIAGVRPLNFNKDPANYAGPIVGVAPLAGTLTMGILNGVSKNTVGSTAMYAGASLLGVGAFAGIGWLQLH